MTELPVRRLCDSAVLPTRAHVSDAGLDLATAYDLLLGGHEIRQIGLGIAVAVPEGHYGYITGRSSTIFRYGLLVVPGVVDTDYRGEVSLAVVNETGHDVLLAKHTRLAQLIVHTHTPARVVDATSLTATMRGTGGFGSTGV